VIDGENGMLVTDEVEMADAVGRLESIDPERCRSSVAERYDVSVTVEGYERVNRRAIAAHDRRHASHANGSAARRVQSPNSPLTAC
jgi:hypothetical protein